MSLLAKSRKEGQIQHITPQSAGWRYIGFDVWMLKKGQSITLESGERELCLVLVAGLASVKTTKADFPGWDSECRRLNVRRRGRCTSRRRTRWR
jgi:5-deoxy-glucuronate isomerase